MASSTFSGSPVTVTQLGSGAPLCGKRMSTWKEHTQPLERAPPAPSRRAGASAAVWSPGVPSTWTTRAEGAPFAEGRGDEPRYPCLTGAELTRAPARDATPHCATPDLTPSDEHPSHGRLPSETPRVSEKSRARQVLPRQPAWKDSRALSGHVGGAGHSP